MISEGVSSPSWNGQRIATSLPWRVTACPCLDQAHERDLGFQALNIGIGKSGHGRASPKNLSRA